MSIERIVRAADEYLSLRSGLDAKATSYVGREAELEKARADLALVLNDYINVLAAEVESLQHAMSVAVYRLNRLKALNNRLQARAVWSGDDLSKLLQTIADLEKKQ